MNGLAKSFRRPKHRLRSRLRFLLPSSLLSLLLLLLIRQRRQCTRGLAHLDVLEWQRELTDVVFDEGSV